MRLDVDVELPTAGLTDILTLRWGAVREVADRRHLIGEALEHLLGVDRHKVLGVDGGVAHGIPGPIAVVGYQTQWF